MYQNLFAEISISFPTAVMGLFSYFSSGLSFHSESLTLEIDPNSYEFVNFRVWLRFGSPDLNQVAPATGFFLIFFAERCQSRIGSESKNFAAESEPDLKILESVHH